MTDFEQRSLEYFLGRSGDRQWLGFLGALAAELGQQMVAEDLRAFFSLVGGRMAETTPLPQDLTLPQLEDHINTYLDDVGWGWIQIEDRQSTLEFTHGCAPLRKAFGDEAMEWAPGVLEGLYGGWLRQLGAGDNLALEQVGSAEGTCDALRFCLSPTAAKG